jgi:ribosomal protein L11 methylase PrmA
LHARSIQNYSQSTSQVAIRNQEVTKTSLLGLVDTLGKTTAKFEWKVSKTSWGDYDPLESYTEAGKEDKIRQVEKLISLAKPGTVWDLGANQGIFSLLASQSGALTIAMDSDPLAVERLYQQCKLSPDNNLLPLVIDLANPTPALGWQSEERLSFFERGPADLVLALALAHHLVIGNNVPFQSLAAFFSRICKALVIEFIPKEDPQIQRMLLYRKDIFGDYRQDSFENAFREHFEILHTVNIQESQRILYLMKVRD